MSNRVLVDVEGIGEVPAVMTTAEFAELIGWSKRYTQQLCQNGGIPSVQTGRNGVHHIPTVTALRKLGFVSGGAGE